MFFELLNSIFSSKSSKRIFLETRFKEVQTPGTRVSRQFSVVRLSLGNLLVHFEFIFVKTRRKSGKKLEKEGSDLIEVYHLAVQAFTQHFRSHILRAST